MNLLLKNPVWSLGIVEAPYPPTGGSDILSQQRHKHVWESYNCFTNERKCREDRIHNLNFKKPTSVMVFLPRFQSFGLNLPFL